MRKDKMLFIFKRYKYNNNKISTSKNLLFLSITLFVINIRSFKFIAKNKSNEDNFDINSSKNIRKRLTSTLRTFKKKMIQKSNFLNIVKIDVLAYYYLIRNKENKLFSLIMNKIYNTFIKSFEILLSIKRDNRILVNDFYLCNFDIKYKKYYKSYTLKNSQLNNIKILISQKMLNKLSIDDHNYTNVFDKL